MGNSKSQLRFSQQADVTANVLKSVQELQNWIDIGEQGRLFSVESVSEKQIDEEAASFAKDLMERNELTYEACVDKESPREIYFATLKLLKVLLVLAERNYRLQVKLSNMHHRIATLPPSSQMLDLQNKIAMAQSCLHHSLSNWDFLRYSIKWLQHYRQLVLKTQQLKKGYAFSEYPQFGDIEEAGETTTRPAYGTTSSSLGSSSTGVTGTGPTEPVHQTGRMGYEPAGRAPGPESTGYEGGRFIGSREVQSQAGTNPMLLGYPEGNLTQFKSADEQAQCISLLKQDFEYLMNKKLALALFKLDTSRSGIRPSDLPQMSAGLFTELDVSRSHIIREADLEKAMNNMKARIDKIQAEMQKLQQDKQKALENRPSHSDADAWNKHQFSLQFMDQMWKSLHKDLHASLLLKAESEDLFVDEFNRTVAMFLLAPVPYIDRPLQFDNVHLFMGIDDNVKAKMLQFTKRTRVGPTSFIDQCNVDMVGVPCLALSATYPARVQKLSETEFLQGQQQQRPVLTQTATTPTSASTVQEQQPQQQQPTTVERFPSTGPGPVTTQQQQQQPTSWQQQQQQPQQQPQYEAPSTMQTGPLSTEAPKAGGLVEVVRRHPEPEPRPRDIPLVSTGEVGSTRLPVVVTDVVEGRRSAGTSAEQQQQPYYTQGTTALPEGRDAPSLLRSSSSTEGFQGSEQPQLLRRQSGIAPYDETSRKLDRPTEESGVIQRPENVGVVQGAQTEPSSVSGFKREQASTLSSATGAEAFSPTAAENVSRQPVAETTGVSTSTAAPSSFDSSSLAARKSFSIPIHQEDEPNRPAAEFSRGSGDRSSLA